MGKLCEVIAVEGELEAANKKILEETKSTFKNKASHFVGFLKRYEPFDDEEKAREAAEEAKSIDTTVNAKLDYMFDHFVRYLDAVAQKEATNQIAKDDVIINGVKILENVPATVLLGLETKLRLLKDVLNDIPTNQPGVEWQLDPSMGSNVYKRVRDEESFRTRKEPKSTVLYEATKEHPAQIEKWNENVNIGKYITTHWSGMLTPAQKSELLGRLDTLSRAVKQARQRANTANVVDIHVGEKIVKFIMNGE